jgi:hypothetical protein
LLILMVHIALMKVKTRFIILFSVLASTGFAQNKLQTGAWRGVLKTSSGNNLPFNFEVSDTANAQQITVINGAERLKVTDVKLSGDSVLSICPCLIRSLGYGTSLVTWLVNG